MQPAGQDPEARLAPGMVTLPLCSRANASPFWIMLLLVWGRPEHGMIPAAVEVTTGAFPGDIVAQGFDAGIRIRRFIQQDMVTTRLTRSVKLILVASRDYLDARGTPKSITDLHQHNCIRIRNTVSGAVFDWELVDGNKLITVKTSGTALVTDITEALSLALAGIGIAYVVDLLARPYLRDGSLKWLLPQAAVEQEGAFLYYPRRASLAPKLRAFIDVAKKTLKSFE